MGFTFFPNQLISDAGVFYFFKSLMMLGFCDGVFKREVEVSNSGEFSFRLF